MLTADGYRRSLSDGRRLFIDGHAVDDVTRHPRFRASVDACAADYDAQYRPGDDAVGAHIAMPSSVAELREQQDMHARWSYPTVSTAQALAMLTTAASRMRAELPENADRALAFVADVARRDVRCAQTITDAKGDRALPPGKQHDPQAYLRIVQRRRDGIVISGAKLHISAAAVCHELIVMPTKRMKAGEEDWAVACAVPVASPGVTVVNTSLAPRPDVDQRSFPHSGPVGLTEGFVVFDEVFVPRERVFLAGEVEHSATFAHSLGLWQRLGAVRAAADVGDTLVGLAQLISEANGTDRIPHINDKVAEMVIYATLVRAGYEAAITHATFTPEGWISPDELYTNAAKYHAAAEFSHMVRHLHDIAGGSVVTSPSLADLDSPDYGAYVEQYMRGRPAVSAEQRIRLFQAIRDFTADAYGGWQHVTVLQGGGGLYAQQVVARKHYDMEHAKRLARAVAGLDGAAPPA